MRYLVKTENFGRRRILESQLEVVQLDGVAVVLEGQQRESLAGLTVVSIFLRLVEGGEHVLLLRGKFLKLQEELTSWRVRFDEVVDPEDPGEPGRFVLCKRRQHSDVRGERLFA